METSENGQHSKTKYLPAIFYNQMGATSVNKDSELQWTLRSIQQINGTRKSAFLLQSKAFHN